MKFSICLTLIIISKFAIAQHYSNAKETQLAIIYEFKHHHNSTDKNEFVKQDMILRISEDMSSYYNYGRDLEEKRLLEYYEKMHKENFSTINSSSEVYKLPISYYAFNYSDDFIMHILKNKSLVNIQIISSNVYSVTEDAINFDWKIQPETKVIGKYLTQKATTTYGGRNYTAWFCSDIPFQLGPWKFGGLPGLILEIVDQDNEVSFTLKEIFKETKPRKIYYNPNEFVSTNWKKMNQLKEDFYKDPWNYASKEMAGKDFDYMLQFVNEKGQAIVENANELIKKDLQKRNLIKVNPIIKNGAH